MKYRVVANRANAKLALNLFTVVQGESECVLGLQTSYKLAAFYKLALLLSL